MKGHIRTLQDCPSCGKPFQSVPRLGLFCPSCKTTPRFLYLDVHFRGNRYRIYSDKDGGHLDSHQRALTLLAKIQYDIEHGYFDPSHYCRKEQRAFWAGPLLDRFWDAKEKTLAPSYRRTYKKIIDTVKAFWGAKDVREIRRLDLVNFRDSLTFSPKTRKNYMDIVKTWLRWCRDELEILPIVPSFPELDVPLRAPRWLSRDDQMALYGHVRPADRPLIAFLMLHGVRPGEARAARVGDVDLGRQTITIRATWSGKEWREQRKGKRSQAYIIPIHPELASFIHARASNCLPAAFLFINPRTDTHYSESSLRRIWEDVRKKAKIGKELRLYDATRHSFASQLRAAGISLANIKDHLGHTDIRTTLKYSHGEIESMRADLDKLSLDKTVRLLSGKENRHEKANEKR